MSPSEYARRIVREYPPAQWEKALIDLGLINDHLSGGRNQGLMMEISTACNEEAQDFARLGAYIESRAQSASYGHARATSFANRALIRIRKALRYSKP